VRSETRVQLVAAFVLIAALGASGVLATKLSSSIGRHKLGYADRALEGDPPQVALGIAMGAFRGLFVNFLWIRANQMKEDGRFYEAVDLATTITKLQPRFPHVWAFHAWNLAYNISVATQTPMERWFWVQSGIKLLREEGVPANPNDLLVHKELAWIFLHKVQGVMDDHNWFYKCRHAGEWTIVLGPPPIPTREFIDRDKAIQAYVDWLTPIERAPDRLSQVIELDPTVESLVKTLREDLEMPRLDLEFLQRYEAHLALARSSEKAQFRASMGPKATALGQLIESPALQPAWNGLIAHARRRILIDEYHMEPARMIRYTQRFGPLDWRHPAAHALYWATRGSDNAWARVGGDLQAKEQSNLEQGKIMKELQKDYDFVNTDRVAIQALQELFRNGELYFDFFTYLTKPQVRQPFLLGVPNVHFVESYRVAIDGVVERGGVSEDRGERVFTIYSAGYENFMMSAIRLYYRRGQLELADKYYKDLAGWAGQNLHDSIDRVRRFSQPLEDFVQEDLNGRAISANVMVEEVSGALMGAYASGLLAGNLELFRSQFQYAKDAHKYFMEKQIRSQQGDPYAARMEVLSRDFRFVAGPLFADFCARLEIDDAESVFGRAPEDLQVFAYDLIAERFRPMFESRAKGESSGSSSQVQRTFEQAFPEPPGMAAYRATIEEVERLRLLQTPNVEQK
jgi:hypothetical protein